MVDMTNNKSGTSSLGDSTSFSGPPPGTAAAAAIDHVGVDVICDQQSLAQAIYARRSGYTVPTKIRIKIGSWNVGNHDCAHDIGTWFLSEPIRSDTSPLHGSQPTKVQSAQQEEACQPDRPISMTTDILPPDDQHFGLYVLGLQEIIDVNSPAEALRPYTDPGPASKFKDAISQALPPGYVLIAEQQLIGLLLLVYASPHLAKDVKSATTTSVGTGLMGYMGNKGAVTAHIVLGETTSLVFINSHLAAGADKSGLDRRNWDAAQIQARTRFDRLLYQTGLPPTSQLIGDEDFAFWFGDLNYRLQGIPGDDVRRLLSLHTPNQSASPDNQDVIASTVTSPVHISMTSSHSATASTAIKTTSSGFHDLDQDAVELSSDLDPASLHTTISSLLSHDELLQAMKSNKAFTEGWQEGPIHFLPTYKYDVGTLATFDSSDKKRNPSWCDRILYRARDHYLRHKKPISHAELAADQHDQLKSHTKSQPEENERIIFDYNPEQDGEHDDESLPQLHPQQQSDSVSITTQDQPVLHQYLSHQNILSSDHKPIEAIFTLTYQAVNPDLKAKTHNKVARLLDRSENEGRPSVTVIVETNSRHNDDDDDEDGHDDHANAGAGTDKHGKSHGTPLQEQAHGIVDFGSMRLGRTKNRVLTIANTGPVPATISLLDRPVSTLGQEGPLPSWLHAAFDRPPDRQLDKPLNKKVGDTAPINLANYYSIPPGETTTLNLTARVEADEFTRQLDDGFAKLDDVLILRVEAGRDHFLPVQASWQQTTSLDLAMNKLKRLPEQGLRKLQNQHLIGTGAAEDKIP